MPTKRSSLRPLTYAKQHYGFTLIELIVAVTIIAITATIGIVSYGQAQRSARNSRRKADLKAIQAALETYFIDNRSYPATSTWCGLASSYSTCGTNWIPGLAPTYMRTLPRDPKTGLNNTAINGICTTNQASYLYYSNGTDYKILAHCTYEGSAPSTTDEFYDSTRPTWAYQVSSPGGAGW